MTHYFLDRGDTARLRGHGLHIRVETQRAEARIAVLRNDRTEAGATGPDGYGHLTVPELGCPGTIVATPQGAPVFPAGTEITLHLEPDRREQHGDTIKLVQQDVGGRYRAELARLRPVADGTEVGVRRADRPSPLAEAAAAAANAVLGNGTAALPTATEIGVYIDATASMAARVGDGSIQVLTDVVAGVAMAVGSELTEVEVLGPAAVPVPVEPAAELATRVGAALRGVGVGIGRGTRAAAPRSPDHLLLVVTDAPLTASTAVPGVRHLVLVPGAAALDAGDAVLDAAVVAALTPEDPGFALHDVVRRLVTELTRNEEVRS